MSNMQWDMLIVGGGIMGCATALRLAEGGMRVLLVEAATLGRGASGVNAGTLSLQIKRVGLMPYALRGHALWKEAGDRIGFRETGGLTLAFTDAEAELLRERMSARAAAGAPIELLVPGQALAIEPQLSPAVRLASWCPADGYANSALTGHYYRQLLSRAGIMVRENMAVTDIEATDVGIRATLADGSSVGAARGLIATGAWTRRLSEMLGTPLPVRARINSVSVTERMPPIAHSVIGHATGLLTLKQSKNGTVLIGGGWQGRGEPEDGRGEIIPDMLRHNLRLAVHALPPLRAARLVRSWTGFEANTPDFYPLAGAFPGKTNLFVLACVRGGFTIGPFIGRLMGDFILGRALELPLFDPARFPKEGISQ